MNRVADRVENIAHLLCAWCECCPDAFAPSLAALAAPPLCELAVDDDEADGLLSQVVGGVDSRLRTEVRVGVTIEFEAFGEVGYLSGHERSVLCRDQHSLPRDLDPDAEHGLTEFVALVDDLEASIQAVEGAPAVLGGVAVRKRGEELHISDEVCEASRDIDAEVAQVFSVIRRVVSTQVVSTQDAIEIFAQDLDEDAGAARRIDLEYGEEGGAEATRLHRDPAVLMPGLLDVESRRYRQPCLIASQIARCRRLELGFSRGTCLLGRDGLQVSQELPDMRPGPRRSPLSLDPLAQPLDRLLSQQLLKAERARTLHLPTDAPVEAPIVRPLESARLETEEAEQDVVNGALEPEEAGSHVLPEAELLLQFPKEDARCSYPMAAVKGGAPNRSSLR